MFLQNLVKFVSFAPSAQQSGAALGFVKGPVVKITFIFRPGSIHPNPIDDLPDGLDDQCGLINLDIVVALFSNN